jgi:sulfite exporter TauE/SafE
MMLFGLGTIPVMMMISLIANYAGIKFHTGFKKLTPLIAIILGFFLIYRGTDMKTEDCCKKQVYHGIHNAYSTSTSY